jgi:hypothetical protein
MMHKAIIIVTMVRTMKLECTSFANFVHRWNSIHSSFFFVKTSNKSAERICHSFLQKQAKSTKDHVHIVLKKRQLHCILYFQNATYAFY